MTELLAVAVALAAGLLMTRVMGRLKFPDVTAYLIAGVLVGPYCLGLLSIEGVGFTTHEEVARLDVLCDVALGFIAFAIGNEFRLSQIKKIGRQATIVGIIQAVTATILVDVCLIGMHFLMPDVLSLPAAITLGAIAAATAPAATLMVVRQYKAKGKLTDILLPVVALDDAVGLVLFSISFGAAKAMQSGTADFTAILVEPLLEIALSLALGAVCGQVLTWLETLFHSNRNRNALIISFVILTVAISLMNFKIGTLNLGFSSLLVCMMLGVVFCNRCPLSADLMERSDRWTAPLLALFFVLSGAELELDVLANVSVVVIGLVYMVARSAGKYLGAYFSCAISGCDDNVKKYLGVTLLPQAGVALGMSALAGELGAADGSIVRNITLFGVLIYELIGPMLTKIALTKAGDIQPKGPEILNRREQKLAEAAQTKGK